MMHTTRTHQLASTILVAAVALAVAREACATLAYAHPAQQLKAAASASAAAYSQFRPPPASDVLRRRQADASARAEQARERQLHGMLAKLVELERQQAGSLDACDEWANLNDRYIELAGSLRRPRASEFHKNQQCRELEQAVNGARARLGQFRQLLLAERDQLEFVSQLLGDYAELRDDLARDELLVREYDALLAAEPRVRAGTANLDSFVHFVGDSLSRFGAVGAAPIARTVRATPEQLAIGGGDEVGQLDRAIRGLVDRELELGDDELRQLNELADSLEQVLASGEQVDLNSGRFRYLSGSLDAARAVLVHKLNEPAQLPQIDQAGPYLPAPRPSAPVTFYEREDENESDGVTFAAPEAARGAGAAASALAYSGAQHVAAAPELSKRADEFRAQYEQGGSVAGALAQAEAATAAVDAAPKPAPAYNTPAQAHIQAQAQAASQASASSSGAGASALASAGGAVRASGGEPQRPASSQAVALAASYAQQQQQAQQQHQQPPPLTLNNAQGGAMAAAAASAQSAAYTSPAEMMSKLRSRRFSN